MKLAFYLMNDEQRSNAGFGMFVVLVGLVSLSVIGEIFNSFKSGLDYLDYQSLKGDIEKGGCQYVDDALRYGLNTTIVDFNHYAPLIYQVMAGVCLGFVSDPKEYSKAAFFKKKGYLSACDALEELKEGKEKFPNHLNESLDLACHHAPKNFIYFLDKENKNRYLSSQDLEFVLSEEKQSDCKFEC